MTQIRCEKHPDAGVLAIQQSSYTQPVVLTVENGRLNVEQDARAEFTRDMETTVTLAYRCGDEECAEVWTAEGLIAGVHR